MQSGEELYNQVLSEVHKRLMALAERIKEELVAKAKYVIDNNNKNDTGLLRGSIDGKIEDKVSEIIITVFAGEDYAQYVHNGTGPAAGHNKYYPSIYPIYEWVKRKNLAGTYSIKTHDRTNTKTTMQRSRMYAGSDQYSQDMAVARAIAWKIYQKGITAFKFFDITLKQSEPLINKMIAEFK